MRWGSMAVLFVLTLAPVAGCAEPEIEGERLVALRREVGEARPPALLLRTVGPTALAFGGSEAEAVMPLVENGEKLASFELYDLFFKVTFVAVEELRALGFDAAASPRIWGARAGSLENGVRTLSPEAIAIELARVGAQETVPDLYRLTPAEKLSLLVSREELLAARTALPLSMRAPKKKRMTARDIRDAFFLADGAPEPPISLDLTLLEHEVAAGGGERRARVKLRVTFVDAESLVRKDGVYEAAACVAGTGVKIEKGSRSLVIGEDEPLERALRLAVRAAVRAALPALAAKR